MKTTAMNRALLTPAILCLALLSMGFEWPGGVARLTRQLRSTDVAERRQAARRLSEHTADDARAAVILALDDEDVGVRLEAIASAARIGLHEHVPILLEWLSAQAADTRVAAAEALGVLADPRGEPLLIRALGDQDALVRGAATRALRRLRSTASLPALIGRLDDTDPSVRMHAAAALGEIGDVQALMPLIQHSDDPALEVRHEVLNVLGSLGDGRALPSLLRALADDTDTVRIAAVGALGRLGKAEAVGPLRARLTGADARFGGAVLYALANIGTEAAIQIVVDQLARADLSRAANDVLVEHVRRHRVLRPAAAEGVVSRLVHTLTNSSDPATVTAVASTLVSCARYVTTDAAFPALLDGIVARRGSLAVMAMALASTHRTDALLPLLQRLEEATDDERVPLLRAVDTLMSRIDRDGRAADPLRALLGRVPVDALPLLCRVLGRTGAERVLADLLTLTDHTRTDVVVGAIEAIGAIGSAATTQQLLVLSRDRRAPVRDAATVALGRVIDLTGTQALLADLDTQSAPDRIRALSIAAAALARIGGAGGQTQAAAPALYRTLVRSMDDDDDDVASLAMNALSGWRVPEAATAIAAILRAPHGARRARAAAALASFDEQRVRHLLRFVIGRDQLDVSLAATSALGQIGEAADAAHVARHAQRLHWPYPAVASHTIALLARRDLLRPLATQALLCELGRSREPIVRANVAVAMAHLGAGACDNGPHPLEWLQAHHSPEVRAAAARWAYAAAQHDRIDRVTVLDALASCAARDSDPAIAEACAAPVLPALTGSVDATVHPATGRQPLRGRLLALQFSDGSIFVGRTDVHGRFRLSPTPAGEPRVFDPGLLPLEPVNRAAPRADAASRPAEPAPAPR